jgi:hypothetical protein
MDIILTEEQLANIVGGKSNFDKIMDSFIDEFPNEMKENANKLKSFLKNYITKTKYNIKFLNSCSAGFAGVRTKDQIIICKPTSGLGDFIYTIFHEIRHEEQISKLKMPNPLSEFDLKDFEKLYKHYWEMELDADQFAKNKVAQLIIKSKIPIDFAKQKFGLSPYVEKYPTMSNMIKSMILGIVNEIKKMRMAGQEYTDIQDMPLVKMYLDKLEDLI